ncbi:hypothetical protein BT69DRAFT_1325445 [Atractiella rhizophila]|nr:hypothetical protein BT69DRAFT_1325445 [Atractiella rhizophila]
MSWGGNGQGLRRAPTKLVKSGSRKRTLSGTQLAWSVEPFYPDYEPFPYEKNGVPHIYVPRRPGYPANVIPDMIPSPHSSTFPYPFPYAKEDEDDDASTITPTSTPKPLRREPSVHTVRGSSTEESYDYFPDVQATFEQFSFDPEPYLPAMGNRGVQRGKNGSMSTEADSLIDPWRKDSIPSLAGVGRKKSSYADSPTKSYRNKASPTPVSGLSASKTSKTIDSHWDDLSPPPPTKSYKNLPSPTPGAGSSGSKASKTSTSYRNLPPPPPFPLPPLPPQPPRSSAWRRNVSTSSYADSFLDPPPMWETPNAPRRQAPLLPQPPPLPESPPPMYSSGTRGLSQYFRLDESTAVDFDAYSVAESQTSNSSYSSHYSNSTVPSYFPKTVPDIRLIPPTRTASVATSSTLDPETLDSFPAMWHEKRNIGWIKEVDRPGNRNGLGLQIAPLKLSSGVMASFHAANAAQRRRTQSTHVRPTRRY